MNVASQNKIIQMIATIKTVYPYYAKETDVEVLVKTWALLLKDVPDNIVEAALIKCLQTCKMPPTPAEVLEQVKAMTAANEPSDEEMWGVLTSALRKASNLTYRFRFTFVEANGKTQGDNARDDFQKLWDGLPEKIRLYLGSPGELMRMSNYDDEELKFEKNRFLKHLPIIAKRQEYTELNLLLAGGNSLLLEGGA
jgi:hypothetical protein